MLTEELNYTNLKDIFYDENSQTPSTQRFNKLLRENNIDFEVCISREDNHLYMYTEFLKIPLFKSRYTCDNNSWVSNQTKLIPLYKVLRTFSSDIKHGQFEFSTKSELAFVYDKEFKVNLELLTNDEVKITLTYYYKRGKFSSFDFNVGDGFLTVYSTEWSGSNQFCFGLNETVPLSEFTSSTLYHLKVKLKQSLKALGYDLWED